MSFFIRKKRGSSTGQALPKRLTERVGTSGGKRGTAAAAAAAEGRTRRRDGSLVVKGRGKRVYAERREEPASKKRHPHDDEEITSEEEDDDDKEEGLSDDDDEGEEETPQQTRIRLAKEQISEVRERLKGKEQGGDDDDDDGDVIGKLLKEKEMVEEGRALRKVLPEGYDARELSFRVLLRGGKVMKSPLTSISTTTICTDHNTTTTIVFASTKSGHVISCNLATSKRTQVLLSAPVTCVCASSRYVAACTPANISLLDPETLRVARVLGGSRGAVWMCVDGGTLYSAHRDRTVKVWDLEEGAYVESLFGHQDVPTFVDSDSGGEGTRGAASRLVISTGGFDKSIRLWKVNEESHLVYNCWEGEDLLDVVKVLGGGLFVVGGGCSGSIGLYCFGRKRVLDVVGKAHGVGAGGVPRWITALGGAGDFVASGSDDGVVKVWRVSEVGKRRTLKFVRDVSIGGGVVIGIDVVVVAGGELSSMVVGLGTEMRNGRWGGRVSNVSSVVVVT